MVVCCQISLRKANQEAVWWPRGLMIQLCHPCAWGAVAGSVPGSGIFTCCRHGQKKEKEQKKKTKQEMSYAKTNQLQLGSQKVGQIKNCRPVVSCSWECSWRGGAEIFYGFLYVGIKNKCTVLYTHCCLQKVVSFLLCLIYFKKVTVLT